jgi:hypothetical protein
MARGADSSRDPRRVLTSQQIARIAGQRSRAMFLAGSESRFPVDAESRVARSPVYRRDDEIDAMELDNDAVVAALMQPELGRQEHTMREATPIRSSGAQPNYGKTIEQWQTEQSGGKWPKGWPSDQDPFPYGEKSAHQGKMVNSIRTGSDDAELGISRERPSGPRNKN